MEVQWAPPSTVLNRPALKLIAYKVVGVTGSIARKNPEPLRPLVTVCQFAPPSMLFDILGAFESTAYRVVGVTGSITRMVAKNWLGPIGVHVPPLSIVLNRALLVDAYSVAGVSGSIATASTPGLLPIPLLAGDHEAPPSVLLKTPELPVGLKLAATYMMEGDCGLIAKFLTIGNVSPFMLRFQVRPVSVLL